jgi:hypothetical protein
MYRQRRRFFDAIAAGEQLASVPVSARPRLRDPERLGPASRR